VATTAIISDLHLGAHSRSDVLRRGPIQERLIEGTADVDRIVLLGDTIELRDQPIGAALEGARPFFEALGKAFAGREVVLVPGNHDHRLLGDWIERSRDEGRPCEIDERVDEPHPAVRSIDGWLGEAELSIRYPGFWVRDDVYATHGHYLDSHVTMPTIERLSVATIDRLGGRPTGQRSSPHDYEQVHAPVYDLIYSLAQGDRSFLSGNDRRGGKPPAMRLWELMGGASGRARTIQGKLLGSAVIPAALAGMERAGFGDFTRDFSTGEIGRAGVDAMHVVVDRLGIEADYVVFGHIHRRGPLLIDDGRRASDPPWEKNGTKLLNTGNWMYVEGLLGRAVPQSPFWPGSMILVPETGEPELVELLGDVDREVLAGRAGKR